LALEAIARDRDRAPFVTGFGVKALFDYPYVWC
jgi:hypothetical protein